MRIAAAIAVAVLWTAAAAAKPADTVSLFREFGLFGVWAVDCAGPSSPDNPHVSVRMAEAGSVLESHDFGAGFEANRYSIVAARKLSGTRLALDALFEQGSTEPQRQLIIVSVTRAGRRTMFTGSGDDPPRVKDGIATATGTATLLLKKCE